jgi:pyruvate/2-oxoglutarate/acetoin dehydrogenase E1 component
VTVIAYGTMVWVSEAAANESGVDAEIIDLRSIWPMDVDTVIESVKKTGRCVIVHEATKTSGFGAELMSIVQESCFHTSRRRSSASPAGTRPTRTRRSGPTSPAPSASPRR